MRTKETAFRPLTISPHSAIEDWFDALSLRLNGSKASELHHQIVIAITIPEDEVVWTLRLRYATLTYRCRSSKDDGVGESMNLKTTLNKGELYRVISCGAVDAIEENYTGDLDAMRTLLHHCGF